MAAHWRTNFYIWCAATPYSQALVAIMRLKEKRLRMRGNILILIFFIVGSCESKHPIQNEVYIGIYGRPKNYIEVKIDDQIVYKEDTTTNRLIEIDRGPILVHKDEAVFFLAVDDKDTDFSYPLKKKNYFNIGYSSIRKEFQFTIDDSVHSLIHGLTEEIGSRITATNNV